MRQENTKENQTNDLIELIEKGEVEAYTMKQGDRISAIAHPCPNWEQRRYEVAKSAMLAMLANSELLEVVTSNVVLGETCKKRVSKKAVEYADSLLEELGCDWKW